MFTITTIIDERMGEEKERLINNGRWKGFGPTSVSIAEKGVSGSCCLSLGRRTRSFSELLTLYMILRPLCIADATASISTHAPRYAFCTFSTTPRCLASGVPDDFINAIKHTPLFQKLTDKLNALKAPSDLYALTKEIGTAPFRLFRTGLTTPPPLSFEGLDISSKTPPSEYQMFKLVANREFMRAVKRVMEELQAAGSKMNSNVCSLVWCSWGNADVVFPFFVLPQDACCRRLWV